MSRIEKTFLFFALVGLTSAQAPTGTIAGVARDPSGAAVSGAHVKLTSRADGLARTVVTFEQGDYSLPALLAGEYEVSVEASGFQRMVRQAVVEAGGTTTRAGLHELFQVLDQRRVFGQGLLAPAASPTNTRTTCSLRVIGLLL